MPKVNLAESLAAAIRKGKFYHLFFGRTYLESYYFPETAKSCEQLEGCRIVYISCANHAKENYNHA
jgi:hypothetical protein